MFVSFVRQNHQSLFGRILKLSAKKSQLYYSTEKLARQFPKCVYIQPPHQWLMCKINFQRVKAWDEKFDEPEFKNGAKQASLMLLDIIRLRDTNLLAKISTIKGFYQIHREFLNYPKDPKRNLLHFDVDDIRYINPVEVHLVEDREKCKCDVVLFFMCMRYLDDIVSASKESKRNDLLIHRDIRSVENLLRKNRKSSPQKFTPTSEKILFIEGYLRLNTIYSKNNSDTTHWRVALFHFSTFNIVPMKASK